MPAPATRGAWRDAAAELAARDSVLATLHARHGAPSFGRGARPDRRFAALAESIAHQQLAGRAAATIWGRVTDAVGDPVTPDSVLSTPVEQLRAAGLSGAKTAAVVDLAEKCAAGTVRLDRIARLDDATVIEHLTVVRGIGPWTAQMFLLFDLGRLDVWPTGDYGVRAGGRAPTATNAFPPSARCPRWARTARPTDRCWRGGAGARWTRPHRRAAEPAQSSPSSSSTARACAAGSPSAGVSTSSGERGSW